MPNFKRIMLEPPKAVTLVDPEPTPMPQDPAKGGFLWLSMEQLNVLGINPQMGDDCCPTPVCQPAQPPQPPPAPPTRFGATRIVMAPDPDRPQIVITETGADTYVVYINGMIMGNANYYAELITLLNTMPATGQMTINIGSPGGSLNTGAMIANAVKKSKAPITTIAIGMVASAAALIWSYGKIRKVTKGSIVMFHMSSHFAMGNSKEIQIEAENIVRYVKEVAIDPLVQEGLLTAEEAETIIDGRRNCWLTSAMLEPRLEKLNHV